MAETSLKPLSPLEWESLIDDHNHGAPDRLRRWNSGNYSGEPLLDFCISSLARKDLPVQTKLSILTFLEHGSILPQSSANSLLETLKSAIQSPSEPLALKDQFLISTTAIFISSFDVDSIHAPVTGLVELLLTIVNRPNHGLDRSTRGVACECLRQLELGFPCLLSEIIPQLWTLCQSERTHVAQSYILLLSTAVLNFVKLKPGSNGIASIGNATIPLIPFNLPRFLVDGVVGSDFDRKENDNFYKELKRVIAFLLECPQNLTPFGLVEFMVAIIPLAEELELQASLLRVQFSGLLYTYQPLLSHAFLGMYLKFFDSFQGQELEVARRLLLLSKESQHHLVFRLLGLHWLSGFSRLMVSKDVGRKRSVLEMSLGFYPAIFDPLAVKALKLDLLAYCSVCVSDLGETESGSEAYDVKLFKDGLVSVSAFKWLPPWSTETAVAFRTFHKFLIGASPHVNDCSTSVGTVVESNIFYTLQNMLVDSASEFRGLVPVTVSCIDRLLSCHKHRLSGEYLLETLDRNLLPKLKIEYPLGSYFPIFERISENYRVSPNGLLELLMKFMFFLIEKHGPDTGLKSWHHGSKVLGICRTMMINHSSSSLFTGLSRLLASTCLFFPDLEVRDNARFYLRILISIPGKKLRHILNMGEHLSGISPPTHSTLNSKRKTKTSIDSYIHIERLTPLLVKQSWSLSLPNLYVNPENSSISGNEHEKDLEISPNVEITPESELHQKKEPLRVMDAKISEIVQVLRRHFSCIPDYRHKSGIKIRIPCSLRFDSEPIKGIYGIDKPPALYATVLKFTSSAPYGKIPSFHIAFLLGSNREKDFSPSQMGPLAIVPVDTNHVQKENFESLVRIELELQEPMPGLIEVFLETNADNGQIIQGQISNIPVGIEDMFLKPILPDDVTGDAVSDYYVDLFDALWGACESNSSTGRETFFLKGGKGAAAINGTRSVKLLEVSAGYMVQAIERYLAPFVVCVIGEPLVDMVREGGVIKGAVLKAFVSDSLFDGSVSSRGPLYLKYVGDEEERGGQNVISRKYMGYFHILIFLPPRFHLLFQMEVRDGSTLVRIRTDHWPCLAYIDDYLEALFLE